MKLVNFQDDTVKYIKMKRTSQLNRLMKLYCELQNLDFSKIVFLNNGRLLRPEHTPNEVQFDFWHEDKDYDSWIRNMI